MIQHPYSSKQEMEVLAEPKSDLTKFVNCYVCEIVRWEKLHAREMSNDVVSL